MVPETDRYGGMSIDLPLPVPEGRLFRHAATNDILRLLAANPHAAFGVRDIRRATGHSPSSVTDAVDLLDATELVTVTHDGNRKLARINRDRLSDPDDPILRIPQAEFRDPVRALVDRLTDALAAVRGVVLFGSVARGEADRRSDVDCFVLVAEDRALAQRTAHEVADDLADERFGGDRYEFQVLVESPETARQHGDRLRDIFAEGLALVDTETLRDLRSEVLTDGR